MKKEYISPFTKENNSRLRTSILAGSTSVPVDNPTGGDVSGKDFPIESRKRIINNNFD